MRCAKEVTIGDSKKEITFKYEKLPEFCLRCGRLNHVQRECTANIIDPVTGLNLPPYDENIGTSPVGRMTPRRGTIRGVSTPPLTEPVAAPREENVQPIRERLTPLDKGKGIALTELEPPNCNLCPSSMSLPYNEPVPNHVPDDLSPVPRESSLFHSSSRGFNFGPFQYRANVPPLHPNDYYQPFVAPIPREYGVVPSSNVSLTSSWSSRCSTPSSLRNWLEREHGSLIASAGYLDKDSTI